MSSEYKYVWNQYYCIPEYWNINYKDTYEYTALMETCYWGMINVVRLLLSHPDIDINAKNDEDDTALYFAKQVKNKKLIKLLKSYGAQ